MLALKESRFSLAISLSSYSIWPVVGMPRRRASAKDDFPGLGEYQLRMLSIEGVPAPVRPTGTMHCVRMKDDSKQ